MNKKTKINIVRLLLLIGTIVSLFYVPWILVYSWILPLPDTMQEQADEAITHGLDGIIVYVDQGGKTPEFYAAGWHDRKNKIPANPHALFKIASIGKLYHALAITKLVGSGRISLDKTLADYFPEYSGRIENANKITVRMIVKHRSGIPSFTNTPGFWVNPPKSQEETIALILDKRANFDPDSDYEYSNTNYLLLSILITKVTGLADFEYIREVILNPLGLKNTYGSFHEVNLDSLMSGYYVGIEDDIKTADYHSFVATAEDVGIFLRALNDGSIFHGGEKKIYSSIYHFEHTGLIPGYQSIARYHKDIDAVVIQFVNTTNFDGYTWSIGEIVYERFIKILINNTSS